MSKDKKIDYYKELVKFDKEYSDEAYAYEFWVVRNENDFFEYYSDLKGEKLKEFSSMMKIFASADGTGARYAFWLRDKDSNYNNSPIVCFGSEGEMYVVAEDIKALLKMASFGVEILHEGSFYADCDPDDVLDDEEAYYKELFEDIPYFETFREWMRDTLKIEPVDIECLKKCKCNESEEIKGLFKKATQKYKKEFDILINEYFPYIKEWNDKQLKEYQEKKQKLLKEIEKEPRADIYMKLASNEEMLDEIDYEQRDKYREKALELEPNNIELLEQLASKSRFIYPQKALSYYLRLLELSNKPKKYYGDIAYVYNKLSNRESAIKYYKKAIEAGDNGYKGSYQKFFVEICEKLKSKDCIKELEDTLKVKRDFYTYKALYEYYFKQKNHKKWLENLLNYVEYSDEDINAFIRIGKKLFKKGFYKETVALFEKLLSQGKGLKKNKLLLLNYIGVSYLEMEPMLLDKAFNTLKEAYKLQNNEEIIWNNIKVCANKFLNTKQYEKAIGAYDFCINKVDMQNGGVYNNKGVAYEKLGKLDKALECFKKAAELDKNKQLYIDNIKEIEEKLRK